MFKALLNQHQRGQFRHLGITGYSEHLMPLSYVGTYRAQESILENFNNSVVTQPWWLKMRPPKRGMKCIREALLTAHDFNTNMTISAANHGACWIWLSRLASLLFPGFTELPLMHCQQNEPVSFPCKL